MFGLGFAYIILMIYSASLPHGNRHHDHNSSFLHYCNETRYLESVKATPKVRVLCWVMIGPNSHHKVLHVKRMWGKRCNKLLFMSSEFDPEIPTVALEGVQEGRQVLWGKTKAAFKYVYDHHFEDADWFMKGDFFGACN